ncbi:MAG: prepilin peptidase [Desulfobacterales bacterium]|nr:prepilin peptidase [Desulfobacterales bacterium]
MFLNAFDVIVILAGLCIGSFLNVCIYRLPHPDQSIVFPGSKCPVCDTPIRFYDNIPVLSVLLLAGKCRHCKTPISLRYPLVELLSGLAALAVLLKFGYTLNALIAYLFIATMIVVTFIDIDHQKILDIITLPGIVLCFFCSFCVDWVSWQQSAMGILTGGGSLYLVAKIYFLLTGKMGMGGGDIKLLAMIGGLTGWQGVLFTIFAGSATGTVAGVILIGAGRFTNFRLKIPFGPFLALGAVTYLFYGKPIFFWYIGLFH